MNNSTSPTSLSVLPNLPVSTDEMSDDMREAIAHIFSSPYPWSPFCGGCAGVTVSTGMVPWNATGYGGYFRLDYLGGGTAEAYGDQIDVMAGAA